MIRKDQVNRALVGLMVGALGVVGVLVSAGPAGAATCSPGNCTGQDPKVTGCESDAITVANRPITVGGYFEVGEVDLRWSPTCQTNWARVSYRNGESRDMEARVEYQSGFSQSEHLNSPVIWTNMVNGQGICVRAWGKINGAPWDSGEAATNYAC